MTNLLARILLAIMVLPLTAVVYVVCMLMFMRNLRDEAFLVAGGVSAGFAATYWILLWRRSIRWTPFRIFGTFGAGVVSVGVAAFVALLLMSASNIREDEFGYFVGGVLGILLWFPLTILLWRETANERMERLRSANADVLTCPRCGYNLTGLHEARCPECGAQYTLNQLLASQHRDEIADAATP